MKTSTLEHWRSSPVAWIENHLVDPETNKPFVLFAAEKAFLAHAFTLDDSGRLRYPELIFSAITKSGKTGFAALILLTILLLYGGRYAEGYCVANDLEQSKSRVFEMVRRIVRTSPLLKREAKITADRIIFPATGAVITALASDYASAAGGHPTIAVFDELWGYTSERSRRLFDELIPVPTRRISCRLVVTHAGFTGESVLLEDLYRRGLQQQQVGPDLYAGDGLLMAWNHTPIAPWPDERWLNDMRRSLRPNQYARMIRNEFVATDSSFIDLVAWDRCTDPNLRPILVDRELPVWVGLDASTKHDSTAIAAVTFDRDLQKVRLVTHKIFQPSPDRPIDFASMVEQTIWEWAGRYRVRGVWFDPYQLAAVSQRLTREGIKIVEYPQTSGNLTETAENLYTLVRGGNFTIYPDDQIRLAVSQAIAVESGRGWRITKEKQSHRIDIVVALSMASLAAVRAQKHRPIRSCIYSFDASVFGGKVIEIDPQTGRPLEQRRSRLMRAADGSLEIAGGNNDCWPGPGHPTRVY